MAQAKTEIENTKRVGDFPAAMPDDEERVSVIERRAREQALEQDENLESNEDEDTGVVTATVNGHGINPSSTYPGRNADLIANDMRIPTEVDLARRAAFAGTQVPARVHAAGLAEEAGADELEEGDNLEAEENDNQE